MHTGIPKILVGFLTLFFMCSAVSAYNINLPYEEDFSDTGYLSYSRSQAECSLVHEPTGGWNGQGALKIFPPGSPQTYCGLSSLDGFNPRQLNARVLVYFGPEFASRSNREDKFIIFNRDDDVASNRAMTVIDNNEGGSDGPWISFATCQNALCHWYPYQPGDAAVWNPNSQETFKVGPITGRQEEWISIEFEADLDGEEVTTFIYTQDGEHAGPHVIREFNGEDGWADTNGYWRYIDMIGGYWNDWGSPSAGNYMKLSHLRIDDQYIGPPTGFLSGGGCTNGQTRSCDTGQQGVCSAGTETCTGDTWGSCVRDTNPSTELCTGSQDEDCDGLEDCLDTTDCASNSACQTSGGGGIFFDDDFESGIRSFNSNDYSNLADHTQFTIQPNPNQNSDNPSANVLRYNFINNQNRNDYITQHFGDSTKRPLWPGTEGNTYDEIYVQFKLMYSSGFDWSAGNNKIMIFGTEDGNRHDASNPNPWAADYTTILAGGDSNSGYFEAEGNNKRRSNGDWLGMTPNIAGYSAYDPYPIETERWYTLEVHKRLNDFGQSNGVWEFWIDGEKVAEYNNLLLRVPWDGTYGSDAGYGINWVMLSTYIDDPAPQNQYMYYDDMKFSTSYIGTGGSTTCTNGQTRSCNTGQQGVCSAGTETCSGGSWGSCVRNTNPSTELCTNSLDDDCNGQTDCSDSACSSHSSCQSGGGGSEVIVDNSDSGFSSSAGSDPRGWWPSSYPNPYGTDSLGSNTNFGSTATWTPNLPSTGTYEVYAWWTAGELRATDATYTINHAGGSNQVSVDQNSQGGQWNLLGTYTFNSGTSGSVVLSDASILTGQSDAVCADAIRWTSQGSGGSIHPADNNPANGCVLGNELTAFIALWKQDSTTYPMREMMDAVGFYLAGTGCS